MAKQTRPDDDKGSERAHPHLFNKRAIDPADLYRQSRSIHLFFDLI